MNKEDALELNYVHMKIRTKQDIRVKSQRQNTTTIDLLYVTVVVVAN